MIKSNLKSVFDKLSNFPKIIEELTVEKRSKK